MYIWGLVKFVGKIFFITSTFTQFVCPSAYIKMAPNKEIFYYHNMDQKMIGAEKLLRSKEAWGQQMLPVKRKDGNTKKAVSQEELFPTDHLSCLNFHDNEGYKVDEYGPFGFYCGSDTCKGREVKSLAVISDTGTYYTNRRLLEAGHPINSSNTLYFSFVFKETTDEEWFRVLGIVEYCNGYKHEKHKKPDKIIFEYDVENYFCNDEKCLLNYHPDKPVVEFSLNSIAKLEQSPFYDIEPTGEFPYQAALRHIDTDGKELYLESKCIQISTMPHLKRNSVADRIESTQYKRAAKLRQVINEVHREDL